MRWPEFPKLISYLIKWTAIGIFGGLAWLAGFLLLDIGGFGSMVWRSSSPGLVLYILGMSFAFTGATFAVGSAVMLRKDFGGDGGSSGNARLDRWRKGGSAELDPYEDKPLP